MGPLLLRGLRRVDREGTAANALNAANALWKEGVVQHYLFAAKGEKYCNVLRTAARSVPVWAEAVRALNAAMLQRHHVPFVIECTGMLYALQYVSVTSSYTLSLMCSIREHDVLISPSRPSLDAMPRPCTFPSHSLALPPDLVHRQTFYHKDQSVPRQVEQPIHGLEAATNGFRKTEKHPDPSNHADSDIEPEGSLWSEATVSNT